MTTIAKYADSKVDNKRLLFPNKNRSELQLSRNECTEFNCYVTHKPEHIADLAVSDLEHQHSGQRRNISAVKEAFPMDRHPAPAVS